MSHRLLRAALALTVLSTAGLTVPATPAAQAKPPTQALVPTEAARAAGVEPGNAPMGWSLRAAESAARQAAAPKITGTLGIDVSSWQGNVNWAKQKAAGKTFAYVKATEGTSYRNPYFYGQFTGAGAVKMYRGAYHFAIPNGAAAATQANYFVDHGGAWRYGSMTLPGVLDIEYNPYGATCYGLTKTAMITWINAFVNQYKVRTGRDVVIYTTTDWWTRCTGNTTKFSANPLWAARYGTATPGTLPGSWRFATFWQYSSTPIDQNKFCSTLSRLGLVANNGGPRP